MHTVVIGGLTIGGDAPVRVESMLKTPVADVAGCRKELEALRKGGCELVRVAFPTKEAAPMLETLLRDATLPLMADIHFDADLALRALDMGCPSVRINPGNMPRRDIARITAAAVASKAVIRIGANSGSLNNKQLENAQGDRGRALVEAVKEQARLLLDHGFQDIILSAKSTSVRETVLADTLLAQTYPDLPMHIGVTEAGSGMDGLVRSTAGLSLLLAQGIGDTLRVSLTGPSIEEVRAGFSILRALELRMSGVTLISCPTCGRKRVDVAAIVEGLRRELDTFPEGLTLAVMGCEVNGPREASHADLGIAGAPKGVILFRRGEKIAECSSLDISRIVEELKQALEK
ncbi:flavodoxin-dependent (E)-4-hydroxy-3-methylbut-2-enyl-diphosphate synthase [Aminiphilus sp.]|uniref:flavodoxin-dependent (E)-4-hydroxy-3-methylbut-2-enyl-diphosphate synthase n=1 Tax=Aminiphilus sp. TaxID=1872488 RepID=UPI002634B62A|nr:flavodoxin-dependent (E)-4-hydroxy-3-methylbut-2-enyl-diphosphate synthase [Aminiphilus sp.]